MKDATLTPIGHVESALTDPADAPRQAHFDAPPARIVFGPKYAAGAVDLKPGDDIWVLTWLDRARRDAVSVHPHGDPDNPETGVFSTRSPHRPNPIGLHRTTISDTGPGWIEVSQLEAVHSTPVLDVKPALQPEDAC